MSHMWLAISLLVPLAGAGLALFPRVPRAVLLWLPAVAALPALATAVTLPAGAGLPLPDVLFGSRLALSETSRLFLLFTALLWTLAGGFSSFYHAADPRLRSYVVFFLVSLTGNLGLFVATDIPLFYTSFAVMTFAAYGLVVHTRSPEAVRAGQLYIGMAIFGEILVLSGTLWVAFSGGSIQLADVPRVIATSPHRHAMLLLLLFGFGVKAGMLGVHVWLPLAHPVAPTPASAVLSGSMIKAGLFGWLVFLPGGEVSLPGLGSLCIALGLIAALGAAVAALTQTRPKANLAYSSISQMGVMTIGIGIGLSQAKAWPVTVGVLGFYALNHAFAKGALFMAVGAAHAARSLLTRRLVLAGVVLGSLAIAGGPLTGGAAAKEALKKLFTHAPGAWADHLEGLLLVSTFATTLLLARLVQLIHRELHAHGDDDTHSAPTNAKGQLVIWGLSVTACLVIPWVVPGLVAHTPVEPNLSMANLLKAWPVGIGIGAAWLLLPWIDRFPGVPAGDLGLWILRICGAIGRAWCRSIAPRMEQLGMSPDRLLNRIIPPGTVDPDSWPEAADRNLRMLSGAGAALLTLIILLWWSVQA